METIDTEARLNLRDALRIVAHLGVIACATAGLIVLFTRPEEPRQLTAAEWALIPSPEEMATPFSAPGIFNPPLHTPEEVTLNDDEPVIGLLVDDEARAYRLSAFAGPGRHVVNHVVARLPLSVTYCDRTNCGRVFRTVSSASPINLACAGWTGDQLLLKFDDTYFEQTAVDAPLEDMPFEETSWLRWKTEHPQTKVYIGPASDNE